MAERLTAKFAAIVEPYLDSGNQAGLRSTIKDWETRLACIEPKESTYNKYDWTDATHLFQRSPRSGRGWTAHLLEHCRKGGTAAYLDTGNERTDFCLISRELGLSISSKKNLVSPGNRGCIAIDALGVRRCGSIGVVEVKGPDDSGSVKSAVLQALCGALGLFAMRQNLTTLAIAGCGRRPAFPNAAISDKERSIALYVVAATGNFDGGPTSIVSDHFDMDQQADMLFTAWPLLSEILLSEVHSMQPILQGVIPITGHWRAAD